MKYNFSYTDVESLDRTLAIVATNDSQTVLSLGARDLGDNILVVARITTAAEQLVYQLSAKKPKGWDGTNVQVAVKSKIFSGTLQSLLSFKEDIFLNVDGTKVTIGVEGKAEVPVEIFSEIPEEQKPGQTLFGFQAIGAEFSSFLKKGLLCSAEVADQRGTQNAILQINTTNGQMTGVSTDGQMFAKSSGKVKMAAAPEGNEAAKAQIDAMKAALEEFCKDSPQEVEAFNLIIPHDTVQHLKTIIDGQQALTFFVDGRRVFLKLANVATYGFVMGSTAAVDARLVSNFIDSADVAVAGFDAETLLKGVDFVNKINSLNGDEGKYPLRIALSDTAATVTSGAADQIRTVVKISAKSGSDEKACANGKYVRSALSYLSKGNVVVRFKGQLLVFQNGTVDGFDSSGAIGLMQVAEASSDEEDSVEVES